MLKNKEKKAKLAEKVKALLAKGKTYMEIAAALKVTYDEARKAGK